MDRRVIRRIVLIAALIALAMCVGTAGFWLLEGYSLFDGNSPLGPCGADL
jgi:hypothetical protein